MKKISENEFNKARQFVLFVNEDTDRHIAAVTASAGYCYRSDIERLITILIELKEFVISERLIQNLIQS
jgi:hypothetical protein